MLSEVLEGNEDFRFHSEYFKKKYLRNLDHISKFDVKYLKEISVVADGDHSKFPENQKEEVLYLQAKDIKSNFLQVENPVYVSKEYFFKNKRSTIKPESILISIMGNVGDIAITPKNFEPCMANRALAILRDIKSINAYFLFVYLISKSAFLEIERIKNGGVQERINLDILGKIPIPILPQPFQSHIANLVQTAHSKLEESKKLYSQAEQILLEELGLGETPRQPTVATPQEGNFGNLNISVKSFSESFGISGRLDAEYYQPKYDEILEKIRSYKGGFGFLDEVCNLKDKNYTPVENQEYNYLELSNIGNSGEINGFTQELGKNLPSRARRIVSTGNVLISSVEGSLEKTALITEKYDQCLCSTGFYVLNSKILNSETLLTLFKSKIILELLKKSCSGTILTSINKDDLLKIIIPKVDLKTQVQIAELIQTSFRLRFESKELLERAKREVEEEIEKG